MEIKNFTEKEALEIFASCTCTNKCQHFIIWRDNNLGEWLSFRKLIHDFKRRINSMKQAIYSLREGNNLQTAYITKLEVENAKLYEINKNLYLENSLLNKKGDEHGE